MVMSTFKRQLSTTLLSASLALFATSCLADFPNVGTDSGPALDGTTDSPSENGTDAGWDSPVDSGPEAESGDDTGPDGTVDSAAGGEDAALDVSADSAAGDAGADGTTDSATDSGDTGSDSPVDSGHDADAMTPLEAGSDAGTDADSGGGCSAGHSFGTPTAVPGINTAFNDYTMRLSPNESFAFLTSDRPFDAGPASGLFQASRGTLAAPFGAAAPVPGVTGNLADPSPTGDLLKLFFNTANGPGVIDSAARASIVNSFGNQAPVANIHGSGNDYTSYVLPDGNVLYFSSNRPGGQGAGDIYRSGGFGPGGFGAPVDVSEINSSADEWSVAVTPDDLTIYFGSTRTDGSAQGGYDVWTATRPSPTAPFASPTILATVSSPQDDIPTWISPDNCRLYLSSKRAGGMGGFDVYVAVRGP
jgi:hypothetical protein